MPPGLRLVVAPPRFTFMPANRIEKRVEDRLDREQEAAVAPANARPEAV